jgi:hypothetical protein
VLLLWQLHGLTSKGQVLLLAQQRARCMVSSLPNRYLWQLTQSQKLLLCTHRWLPEHAQQHL